MKLVLVWIPVYAATCCFRAAFLLPGNICNGNNKHPSVMNTNACWFSGYIGLPLYFFVEVMCSMKLLQTVSYLCARLFTF